MMTVALLDHRYAEDGRQWIADQLETNLTITFIVQRWVLQEAFVDIPKPC